jgi:hypothetical protein
LPATVHVTVTAQTGTCNLSNFVLTFTNAQGLWLGNDNNGQPWELVCQGTNCAGFRFEGNNGYGVTNASPQAGCACNPLDLVFGPIALNWSGHCSGSVTFTVTL